MNNTIPQGTVTAMCEYEEQYNRVFLSLSANVNGSNIGYSRV